MVLQNEEEPTVTALAPRSENQPISRRAQQPRWLSPFLYLLAVPLGGLYRAAKKGRLHSVQRLAMAKGVGPECKGQALMVAAEKGHLEVVCYLVACKDISPEAKGRALIAAAEKDRLEIVRYLGSHPEVSTEYKNFLLKKAVVWNRFEIVQHLATLDVVSAVYKGEALVLAAKEGHLGMVRFLQRLESASPLYKGSALVRAAEWGQIHIVENLLSLDIASTYKGWALEYSAERGCLESVQYLLSHVNMTPDDKNEAFIAAVKKDRLNVIEYFASIGVLPMRALHTAVYYESSEALRFLLNCAIIDFPEDVLFEALKTQTSPEITQQLIDALLKMPISQAKQLQSLELDVTLYEETIELLSQESAMNEQLESQADLQYYFLSKKYEEAPLSEGLKILRAFVIEELLTHLKAEGASCEQNKVDFLEQHQAALINGNKKALIDSRLRFNAKDDIYETAFRAINPYAPHRNNPWPNLLTENSQDGEWAQRYATNIAREIASLREHPHYKDYVLSLISQLSEIRRAHNEDDPDGVDDAACYPGVKTRLLKILDGHPDYKNFLNTHAFWKTSIYEGAKRHIQKIFRQNIQRLNREEAEALLESLSLMSLENAWLIIDGRPIDRIINEPAPYSTAQSKQRHAFIKKVREGLLDAINDYLLSQELPSILEDDAKMVYVNYLAQALGEPHIAPALNETFVSCFLSQKEPVHPNNAQRSLLFLSEAQAEQNGASADNQESASSSVESLPVAKPKVAFC